MGRPRGEVPAGQVLLRAASRRTGRDGFPIIRLSSDRCLSGMGAHAGHPAPVRRSALRIPPGRVMSDHLASFALRTAFPPSLAGRDSGDYYEASVAIGLASRRRSRVRPCHTSQRDVGGPLISFNTLAGRRPVLRRLRRPPTTPTQNTAPVSVTFPADENLHRLEIRLQAIQLSPYHAGPPDTPPLTTGPGRRVGWHALVPFTFRIQVSHSTQEPPSKSLPAAPGIQQGASRRTWCARRATADWPGSVPSRPCVRSRRAGRGRPAGLRVLPES
jgi:hypothetical protein